MFICVDPEISIRHKCQSEIDTLESHEIKWLEEKLLDVASDRYKDSDYFMVQSLISTIIHFSDERLMQEAKDIGIII